MVEKSGSNDQRRNHNSYFLEKISLFDVDLFPQTFHVEMPYFAMSILQEQAVYGHHNENTSRNGQIKKIMGNFSEHLGTSWIDLIYAQIKPVR